uniref:Uncharacterized protein n=1 Tax=Romanomermis culicivorax TaxID=13658 RepID=A0A915KUI3_ROMCU
MYSSTEFNALVEVKIIRRPRRIHFLAKGGELFRTIDVDHGTSKSALKTTGTIKSGLGSYEEPDEGLRINSKVQETFQRKPYSSVYYVFSCTV